MGKHQGNISVHGNGFIQIDLTSILRINVWHPELPRRQSVTTDLHDHRFGFESQIIRGRIRNVLYHVRAHNDGDHHLYRATGERKPNGNRELVSDGFRYRCTIWDTKEYGIGETYCMDPLVFHRSIPVEPLTATLMKKTRIIKDHKAMVMCHAREEPDQEFSRHGTDPAILWGLVAEVLGTSFVSENLQNAA